MHASGENRANKDPEEAGRKAELCGERGPYQRSGAGNGGEVMTEEHPLRRRNVVVAVFVDMCGSGAGIVEREYLRGYEGAVEAIAESEHAEGSQHYGECVHRSLRQGLRAGWSHWAALSG